MRWSSGCGITLVRCTCMGVSCCKCSRPRLHHKGGILDDVGLRYTYDSIARSSDRASCVDLLVRGAGHPFECTISLILWLAVHMSNDTR
jgi:hypothetical protein